MKSSDRKLLVYVAGPISKGDLVSNVRAAHDAGVALLRGGLSAVVPHGSCFWGNAVVHYPGSGAFLPEVLPAGTTLDDWYGLDLEVVRRCDAVLRLPGESTGADMEVATALENGLKVLHSVDEALSWAAGSHATVPKEGATSDGP